MHYEVTDARLVAQVQRHSRSVIEAELDRLARKAPSLARAELDVINAALEELAEALFLDRLRHAPRGTEPLLRRLFGVGSELAEPQDDPHDGRWVDQTSPCS